MFQQSAVVTCIHAGYSLCVYVLWAPLFEDIFDGERLPLKTVEYWSFFKSFSLFGFVLNVPVFNHLSLSSTNIIRQHWPMSHTDMTCVLDSDFTTSC